MNRILDEIQLLNWVSALITLVRMIVAGSTHTFLIPEDSGWSDRSLQRMLKEHGISTWGWMSYHGQVLFTVKRKQAGWAEYLLDEADVPVVSGRISKTATRQHSALRSQAFALEASAIDSLDNFASPFGL